MKKKVIVLCAFVLTALVICTILSGHIQRLMTPEINVVWAKKGSIQNAATKEEAMHDYTLPLAALMQDDLGNYVLALEKIDGVWGPELLVRRQPISSYEAMDESRFAAEVLAYSHEGFAVFPSQVLKDGEKVKVRDK